MNQERRNTLEQISETIGELIAQAEELLEQETEAYDNLPESIQNSNRGESMQTAIDALESMQSSLEEAADRIDDILNA